MVKCFVALIVFCCSVGEAFAQTDTKVTINVNNVLIRTALDQLQREAKIHFVYDEENIDSGKRVSLSYTETPLNAVLDDFCKQTSLRYEVKRNLILILPSKAEKTTGKHEPFYMTGVVTDETGESIIGATIMIGGTSQGTVTDIDGRYSLQVTPGDLVSFTFVGMADKVVKVQAGKKVVNVKMETNATALADVVVTGYQTLSKERATGSYSVISEKSTKGKLETDVLSRIEGLVAGINKTSSNSNDVVIRGITTYMGNTKPLYVVDGMPYEGDLASINPTDVQNITVLKDAADKGGPAKLYNDKGEYIGDSYSAQIRTATMSCCTNGNAFFMTCAGSVSSISEAGKRLHITVIGYIDDKEVNRLEKEYITDGNTLIETFSVSTKEI